MFDSQKFNPEGSFTDRSRGTKTFHYDAGDDSLAVVAAPDFFLEEQPGMEVGNRIKIRSKGSEFIAEVTVSDDANLDIELSSESALSGAGAVDVINEVTALTTTGANALTLADGAVGQRKTIYLAVEDGDGTLTPANALGWSTVVFADAGDTVHLEFRTGGWIILGKGGISQGPIVA
jgi:hypothetical protein